MHVLILKGQAALPAFRAAALLTSLRMAAPALSIATLDAVFVYFIDAASALDSDTLAKLQALLNAAPCSACGDGFIVIPRKGTVSPWSSKATRILHNCGLSAVRRVERGTLYTVRAGDGAVVSAAALGAQLNLLHDRMIEGVYDSVADMFDQQPPAALRDVDVLSGGVAALHDANAAIGLALSDEEIEYLYKAYSAIRRNPTDVELVMFAQVNSEHCRHKIFNAAWIVDGQPSDRSLFAMIRHTHERHPGGVLVAYKDNSSVMEGFPANCFEVRADAGNVYAFAPEQLDMLMKVETHNHPTAISPYPGAATGAGGEIRDESATGIGGKSRAGLCGLMVSNLRIPGLRLPWERDYAPFPTRLATPLQIMIEGPLGGAGYGNEFGRPQLCGLFRTYETRYNGRYRGYHKPIMIAGGMGVIKRQHANKRAIPTEALIIQIGGPAMRIGLGGGAASSMATGTNVAELDFDSVQRDNAEMERRCQEVIDACIALGAENPILSIHDIGAGGLSNACPELVAGLGGMFELRRVPNEDKSMSPMEIWCCEAQERYVLAIAPTTLEPFMALCARERCPAAVIGAVTGDGYLTLHDEHFKTTPIDIDIGVILGKPPKMLRNVQRLSEEHPPVRLDGIQLADAIERVLHLPAVACKAFLITIADRSVSGLVARDQMVGPWQTPVADAAMTLMDYHGYTGQAMAMGERTPIAVVNAAASGRMAIGEALTNLGGVPIGAIGAVKLSANWMCACGEQGEDANLFDTVRAVGLELCPALGVCIPVGKDSLSMRTLWHTPDGTQERMTAPLSLLVSSFATVNDVRKAVTPDLKPGDTLLLLIDLGGGKNRLGCSALAQVYEQVGGDTPDLDDPALFVRFFAAMQELLERGLLFAYHDRSDGGLLVTLAEMAFAGRTGITMTTTLRDDALLRAMFAEELGAVIQIAADDHPAVEAVMRAHDLLPYVSVIGAPNATRTIEIRDGATLLYHAPLAALQQQWADVSYHMQALRDNPTCARQEYDALLDTRDPGIQAKPSFDPTARFAINGTRPRVAILREQGINGHVETAAAFDRAGFECVDVHMTDLSAGRTSLAQFAGLAVCGGFSYGDVLGAGTGWAKSILYNERLKEMFAAFFARPGTFTLGVCNGCQMLTQLKEIIPGAHDWPLFARNASEQFEARYVTVEVLRSPSIFFKDMAGSLLPIPSSHGEGRADFSATGARDALERNGLVAMRFVDNFGTATERYPFNPNGSPGGITGLTTPDGRVTVMMPHPERLFRAVQMSYRPHGTFAGEEGPWLRMFQNARAYVG